MSKKRNINEETLDIRNFGAAGKKSKYLCMHKIQREMRVHVCVQLLRLRSLATGVVWPNNNKLNVLLLPHRMAAAYTFDCRSNEFIEKNYPIKWDMKTAILCAQINSVKSEASSSECECKIIQQTKKIFCGNPSTVCGDELNIRSLSLSRIWHV